MPKSIRIINPASGHRGWISPKNAIKMVKRGIARLEGSAIRLIETDYRFNSEALPRKVVIHAPRLPEPSTFQPCWLNSEAATSWRYQDSPPSGIPA